MALSIAVFFSLVFCLTCRVGLPLRAATYPEQWSGMILAPRSIAWATLDGTTTTTTTTGSHFATAFFSSFATAFFSSFAFGGEEGSSCRASWTNSTNSLIKARSGLLIMATTSLSYRPQTHHSPDLIKVACREAARLGARLTIVIHGTACMSGFDPLLNSPRRGSEVIIAVPPRGP
jgi:hypothetical protein